MKFELLNIIYLGYENLLCLSNSTSSLPNSGGSLYTCNMKIPAAKSPGKQKLNLWQQQVNSNK